MLKRGLLAISILLILLAAAQAAELDDSLQTLADNGTVKIAVEISDQSTRFGIFSADREEIIQDLKENYDVEYVAQTFNSITIEVTRDELEELQERRDIATISKALEFRTTMQDSNSITNATLAGNLQVNGINLTGIGQTICIIDSGINYSHPAFGGCTKEQFLSGNCPKVIGGYAYFDPVNASNLNDVMGDSNHGTHVAGIAAGTGPLRGVAPDAKIVAIKACQEENNGACDGGAVVDGINWCTANAAAYNITVISMSLGTDILFNSACDSADSAFTTAINNATAKNISVIAAAGNNGNRTHISLPACISNVTAVGATTKSDTLVYNRNSLVQLVAPGFSINASVLNGGYGVLSGTSMATPNVAGAFAVILQLKQWISASLLPADVETILNATGKRIMDSTGVNYSRINLYDAVLSLDSIAPVLAAVSPPYNHSTLNTSINFTTNITDWQLVNMTFQLRNESGDLLNETTFNISGMFNESSILISNLSNGSYNWSFRGVDSKMNIGIIMSNLTIGVEANSSNSSDPEPEVLSDNSIQSRSSGGGGGGGSTTFKPNETQTQEGYTKELRKQEAVQFTLFDSNAGRHTLTVNSVGADHVNITIRSDPIRLTLGIGQSAKLNLTSASFYDLLVRLESITAGKARITIQTINEPKEVMPERTNYTGGLNFTTFSEPEIDPAPEPEKTYPVLLYIGVLLLVIAVTAAIVHSIDMRQRTAVRHVLNHKI